MGFHKCFDRGWGGGFKEGRYPPPIPSFSSFDQRSGEEEERPRIKYLKAATAALRTRGGLISATQITA